VADKEAWRKRIWEEMERGGAALFPGAIGRIPNFVGAERAAERLAALPEWKAAAAIKSNPDSPQRPVRARALEERDKERLASPRIKTHTA